MRVQLLSGNNQLITTTSAYFVIALFTLQALVVLALALMAGTEEHEDDETPRLLTWVMTVVMAGYVIAALGALVMQRGARTPVWRWLKHCEFE